MKEHPILFSGAMVRALLDGTKTQTRRVVKGTALEWLKPEMFTPEYVADPENNLCPYGQPGDRLWVREAWRTAKDLDDFSPVGIGEKCIDQGYREPWAPIQYEADGSRVNFSGWGLGKTMEDAGAQGRLRASMHMPRWACRLALEIVSVRVERLQDITRADALDEGVRWDDAMGGYHIEDGSHFNASFAVETFASLWESINGADSWAANPWVWIIEFKKVAA